METTVECRGLTKRYGRSVAVDGLDLAVERGEIVGFLGSNGSGKTTTLRMLLGLIRPTSGEAWINGRKVPHPAGLPLVGAAVEEPAFYPWLTGRANLGVLALSGPRPPAGALDAVLAQVDLAAVADRKVRTYSQGMRQRLGLALALMRSPQVLLLDEPTNGMDPAGLRDFRGLLRRLAASGTTIMLSSHLLTEVEEVCNRVAVIDRGRLVGQGRIGDLLSVSHRVRVVLDEHDRDGAVRALRGWPVRPQGTDTLIVDGVPSRDVATVLAGAGIVASEVVAERSRLDEAFLALTNRHAEGAGNAPVSR